MALLAISSDEHLDVYKSLSKGIVTENGYSKRLQELVDDYKKQKDNLIHLGVSVLIRAGDLFNSRTAINAMTLTAATEVIKYRQSELTEVLIGGNHDEYLFDSRMMSIIPFGSTDVVHFPFGGACYNYKSISIFGIAYQHCHEDFLHRIEDSYNYIDNPENCNILVIHQELSDAPVDTSGTTVNATLSTGYLNTLDMYDWIICGHHHFPHRSGRVFLPGSAAQLNFGDANSTRGVWVLDTKAKTFKQLESTAPPFIQLTLEELNSVDADLLRSMNPYLKIISSNTNITTKEEALIKEFGAAVVYEQSFDAQEATTEFDPIKVVEEIISEAPEELDKEILLGDLKTILED